MHGIHRCDCGIVLGVAGEGGHDQIEPPKGSIRTAAWGRRFARKDVIVVIEEVVAITDVIARIALRHACRERLPADRIDNFVVLVLSSPRDLSREWIFHTDDHGVAVRVGGFVGWTGVRANRSAAPKEETCERDD